MTTEEANEEQTRQEPREKPDQKTLISAPGPRANLEMSVVPMSRVVSSRPSEKHRHSLLSSVAEPRAPTHTQGCCDPGKDRTKLWIPEEHVRPTMPPRPDSKIK